MEFKKLLGNRIYLDLPDESKTELYLDDETKAAVEAEKMKKWGRLRVYAIGSSVEGIEEGDEVMIDPGSAAKVLKIPLGPDKEVLLVSFFDICHIW